MSALADLVRSAHGCIYAYGVIAAYLPDQDLALDAMAAHRRMRDALADECRRLGQDIPAAAPAYPVNVRDATTARAVAADLENAVCAQWASALATLDESFATRSAEFAVQCAVRGYLWSGVSVAFPA